MTQPDAMPKNEIEEWALNDANEVPFSFMDGCPFRHRSLANVAQALMQVQARTRKEDAEHIREWVKARMSMTHGKSYHESVVMGIADEIEKLSRP